MSNSFEFSKSFSIILLKFTMILLNLGESNLFFAGGTAERINYDISSGLIELTDKSSMEEENPMNFIKKSLNFEKTENLKKCLSIFTRKKIKKAINIWNKSFTTPLQNQRKKTKIDENQIKIKFLILALKNLFLLKKKEAFFQVLIIKETQQYESIIKNIVPLTNIFSLLNSKIKQNVINSFEKIKNFSSKTQNFIVFPRFLYENHICKFMFLF